ncbi:MAG: site-specific integrase [Nocardioides sp.]|uniref:site-specific integrase n=1 Tax=Nocardioides sp. TaxID=35761 RepID=UPI003266479A
MPSTTGSWCATRARGVRPRGWGSSGRTSRPPVRSGRRTTPCRAGVRPAILLGAHAGLRLAEAAALRVEDVDFSTGVVSPVSQWLDQPLKSEMSRTSIPIPKEMAHLLAEAVRLGDGRFLASDQWGNPAGPWTIERAIRACREMAGLTRDFRFHDLRHYFASLLIASGLDVKVVQARLRHASAKTTLDTYGHLWPDRDDSSRAAVAAVYREHPPSRE